MKYRPAELLLAMYRRFGPVVRFGRYVYLLGPDANRFVFANSHLFRWREAYEALVPVDGPTALIVSDGDEHQRRRRAVQPALHHKQIDGYVKTMVANADAVIDAWRAGETRDVYRDFRAAIRRSTIGSLFGGRLAARADFVGDQLQPLLDLVDHPPAVVAWQRRLRTPGWRRAMAARARVDEETYAEIDRVRAGAADAGDHVLASLVRGGALSDPEIRDQVVSLIAAGYETTSAAMAWTIYGLLSTPGAWGAARDGDRTHLDRVVQESLRLYPPAVVVARMVAEDFTFAGRRVRAGRVVLCSPYVTHRLPEVWPDPLRFDPTRWDPAAPGYRKPAPHEFLPFAAGPHRCIGSTMAVVELTVMLERLLQRVSLRLVPGQRVRATNFAAMRPRDGLRAEVTRIRAA